MNTPLRIKQLFCVSGLAGALIVFSGQAAQAETLRSSIKVGDV
jgi:hypothetical protein